MLPSGAAGWSDGRFKAPDQQRQQQEVPPQLQNPSTQPVRQLVPQHPAQAELKLRGPGVSTVTTGGESLTVANGTTGSSSRKSKSASPTSENDGSSKKKKKKKSGSSKSSKHSGSGSGKSSSGSSKQKPPGTRAVKAKKVRRLFESVAEQLSEVARLVEGWDQPEVDRGATGDKLAVTKKFRKHLKKSTVALDKLKQSLPACQEYQKINVPASLIAHVDDGNSPGTWVKRLVERCKAESEVVHGELFAVANFRVSLLSKLQEMSAIPMPRNEETPQSPEKPEQPVQNLECHNPSTSSSSKTSAEQQVTHASGIGEQTCLGNSLDELIIGSEATGEMAYSKYD